MNMKKGNRPYNMLKDISFKDIHMCRINVTHTICIWGNHIFDSNFQNTLPLNHACLLMCRSIGMPDDFINKVKEQQRDDDTEGKEYIECWKFSIPKQFIHLMNIKNKKLKNIQARHINTKIGKRKNDANY